jgi:hypothetical protein
MVLSAVNSKNIVPLVPTLQDGLERKFPCGRVDLGLGRRWQGTPMSRDLLQSIPKKLFARTGKVVKSKAQPILPLGEVGKDIASGRWGRAVKLAGVHLPLVTFPGVAPAVAPHQVTERDVGGVFGFQDTVTKECRESYARMIENLLRLPTGRALFEKIIYECCFNNHPAGNANPRRVVFIQNGSNSGHYPDDGPACKINIKWVGRHVGGDGVLIVKRGRGRLDFVGVKIPPAIDLAHELGHFLYALKTPPGGGNLGNRMQTRAQGEYGTILGGIITLPPATPAEIAFEDLWNGGNFVEAVNILPAADILPHNQNRLRYSDGIMIGEALSVWQSTAVEYPQFFDLATKMTVAINRRRLSPESFVRFSHGSAMRFHNVFTRLSVPEQGNFKDLVRKLLVKIRVPWSGHLTVDALPSV